jgi:hypothetical protein
MEEDTRPRLRRWSLGWCQRSVLDSLVCGVESEIAPIQNIAWVDPKAETGSRREKSALGVGVHRGKESGEK